MNNLFYKFPSTPHLAALGNNSIRDDKVLTENERREFLRHKIVIEEKVDGANLGISFNVSGDPRIQSRGEYLQPPYLGQWKKISEWLAPKIDSLRDGLKDRYLLFGEWCYAQHSIFYSRLPDWFLGFDIFDKKSEKFLSCDRRDARLRKLGILGVPTLSHGRFSFDEVLGLLSVSRLGERPAEGIYLRIDGKGWVCGRAKLVRPEFIQSIEEHWSRKSLITNRCNSGKNKENIAAE